MGTPDTTPPIRPENLPPQREDIPTGEPDDRETPDKRLPDDDIDTPEDTDRPGGRATSSDSDGQMDDNIDDLGQRPDGTTQDQPGVNIDELTENDDGPDRN